MKLNRVSIKNFRSIKDIELKLSPRCRVLVGINESGKSNILKALSLLDKDTVPHIDDIRDITDEEEQDESLVKFVFTLNPEESRSAYEAFLSTVLIKDPAAPICKISGKQHSLNYLFESTKETIYVADIYSKRKYFNYFRVPGVQLLGNLKKPSKTCPEDVTVIQNGEEVPLKSLSLVLHTDYPDLNPAYLTDILVEELIRLVNKYIHIEVTDSLPKCILWTYKDANLLPGQISIKEFCSDPEICLPLKQMFTLAGVTDIAEQISEAQGRTNGLKNLLKRVSKLATEHMHMVWEDYKDIKFNLVPNGENIDATIQDSYNEYDLKRRSDGFKRFVTFLLLVSAKVKTNELENILYLHDEPEVSLHPSGARYLRDELIEISKTNYVVYSTHSIFMIDKEMPSRHLIVNKNNEITTVSEVDVSNITDEEVIYNALGYSLFETLKAKNIIFEGWRDKKLFQIALSRVPAEYKALKDFFSPVGLCHVKGVRDVPRVTPILQLAERECLIVTDADQPAKQQQKEHNAAQSYGRWYRYDELVSTGSAMTAEDFIKPEAFLPVVKKFQSINPQSVEIKADDLNISPNRLKIIEQWFQSSGVTSENMRDALNAFKSALFEGLKPNVIEPRYFEVIEQIAIHLGYTKGTS